MNISAYDDATSKINKNTTWVDIKRKELISREISKRKYYMLASRYNLASASFNFYVIMLDEKADDRTCFKTNIDDYGRVKIKLKPIWDRTSLRNLTSNCNITISVEENHDDGDIYFLDV